MIRRVLDIDGYWKVIVYFDIDYNFFIDIAKDLKRIEISNRIIHKVYNKIINNSIKAFTASSFYHRTSVVCFLKHKSKYDYINTIVHESEHIKQAMLDCYKVEDEGEPPAYTVGYIAMLLLRYLLIIKKI